jgi:hypothetical protein
MKLLLLITFSLLSLPLAQAGMELSTPQTDWMQAGRIERREITKKRYHQRAGVSQSQIVFNYDGSITFVNPKLIRGPKAMPIDSAYSNSTGICRLFGLDNYLDDSKEETFVPAQSVATINVDGTYYNQDVRSHTVGAITCYSGRYRTTAIAGGVLFQDGKWLGKIRKVKSRWGNTQAHNVTIATPENGGAHVLR